MLTFFHIFRKNLYLQRNHDAVYIVDLPIFLFSSYNIFFILNSVIVQLQYYIQILGNKKGYVKLILRVKKLVILMNSNKSKTWE